jgi:hypothetical protein
MEMKINIDPLSSSAFDLNKYIKNINSLLLLLSFRERWPQFINLFLKLTKLITLLLAFLPEKKPLIVCPVSIFNILLSHGTTPYTPAVKRFICQPINAVQSYF